MRGARRKIGAEKRNRIRKGIRMSRPRYWWYGNICRVIAQYPTLKEAVAEAGTQSVTTAYSGMPHGSGAGRSTEGAALRAVSNREYDDFAAVSRAIAAASAWPDGELVLAVVNLWHWKRMKNFESIGDALHIGCSTAKRKNSKFVYEVAKNMGYMTM